MSLILLPRLDPIAVDRILADLELTGNPYDARQVIEKLPDNVKYGSSGGTRADEAVLNELCLGLREIATDCGYPERGDSVCRARFDAEAAAWLADYNVFRSGEALRDDVWAFVATVLLPRIVLWRFGISRARFQGGVRNTFQRLWLRGQVFDLGREAPNRWQLLHTLTEDALVQITERPSIGGDRQLARATAEAWQRAARKFGQFRMEDIMRRAAIGIRLRNEVLSLTSLAKSELDKLLDSEFDRAEKLVATPD